MSLKKEFKDSLVKRFGEAGIPVIEELVIEGYLSVRHLELLGNRKRIRFLLMLDPDQEKYLQWCLYKKGWRKAQTTRKAIHELMLRDKEYQRTKESK